MSIRPIDLQVMVQKSSEVSKVINGNERHDANAQVFADVMKKETIHSEQHVTQSHKSEQDAINKDGKGNNAYKKQGEKKGKQEPQAKDAKKAGSDSMFDITI